MMMNATKAEEYLSRDEWLDARKSGVGASEAAAVLGLSHYASPLDVWAAKVGAKPTQEPNDTIAQRMRLGRNLEPVIESEYQHRHPEDIVTSPGPFTIYRHESRPHVLATLDRVIVSTQDFPVAPIPLELKSSDIQLAHDWDDEPPMEYIVQVQHQMATTGAPAAVLSALFGTRQYREFFIRRDDEFIELMLAKIDNFWAAVEAKEEPSGMKPTRQLVRAMARLHPEDSGETVTLPALAVEWDSRLVALKEERKRIADEIEELEVQFKAAIGQATFGQLGNGVNYSWKTQKRKAYSVAASSSRVLRREAPKGRK